MGSLYVLEQGAMVHKHRERLVVRLHNVRLAEIPLVHVDQVVLFGGTHLTSSAASLLLDRDVPVAMCALNGRLRGFLHPAYDRWVPTRSEQVRRSDDPEFCLTLAREIVATKIRNCRSYLRRIERDDRAPGADAADSLGRDLKACAAAGDINTLRGVEGAAAARYFRVVRAAFSTMELGRRGRRAPDPAGALINLAYGLLTVDVLRAVQLAGLDPFVGFYHRPRTGRPNLVLDLMEEWRPVLADSTALGSARRHVVEPVRLRADPRRMAAAHEQGAATSARRVPPAVRHRGHDRRPGQVVPGVARRAGPADGPVARQGRQAVQGLRGPVSAPGEFGYLVVYDIADDARRVGAAETLLDCGASRLQRSVFWLVSEEAGVLRMRSQVRAVVDESQDRVNWYRTCGNCPGIVGHTRAATLPPAAERSGPWII